MALASPRSPTGVEVPCALTYWTSSGDVGVAQRVTHGQFRTIAARRSDVERVATHAEADELGEDVGTARLGEFILFEHEHAGTVGQQEAVAAGIPRTAGMRRIVVTRG